MTAANNSMPYLIPIVTLEMCFVFILTKYFCQRAEVHEMENIIFVDDTKTLNLREDSFIVENVYMSRYRNNSIWKILLLFTRILSAFFFLGLTVIYFYVVDGGLRWRYFTIWNLELISVYYILASFISICGGFYEDKYVEWSNTMKNTARITHILFEVCGATALFVTVVNFTLLQSSFKFENIVDHFITSLSFLWEMSLNSMFVRCDHLIFNLLWTYLYLTVIWPFVTLSHKTNWPYFFLDMKNPTCIIWYTFFFVLNILFYLIWYSIGKMKFYHILRNRKHSHQKVHEAENVDPLHAELDNVTCI